MCLAVPARIVECDRATQSALVELGGVRRKISLMLVDHAEVDDYVLVHVGFALTVLSAAQAEHTLALIDDAGRAASERSHEPTAGVNVSDAAPGGGTRR